MARLEVYGIDELDEAFRRLGEVPDSVVEEAVLGMADVAAAKIRAKGEAKGIRAQEARTHILDRVRVGKFKKTDSGGYVNISFSGTQKKTPNSKPVSNARVAFENEYGNSFQRARPFVGPAMAEEDAIVRPAAETLGEWAEKNFENS